MTGPVRQLAILPDDPPAYGGPVPVAVTAIATSGRTEYTAHCPQCSAVHRHTRPGIRRGPCGATYTVPSDNEGDDDTP